MLRQALLAPFYCSPPTPGSLHRPVLFSRSLSHQEEEEASMEVVLKGSSLPETLVSTQQHEVERSSLLGDEFSVDDLLDFGGLTDVDQEEAVVVEEEDEEEEEEAQPEAMEADNPNSCSSSSALSLEQTPPSEITLSPADVDVAGLEWVSRFVDDSFSDFPPPCSASLPWNPATKTQSDPKPQAEPPSFAKRTAAYVLSTEAPVPVKAKRSKRSRAPRWLRSVPEPASSSPSSSSSSSSPSSPPSVLLRGSLPPAHEKPKKKRGRKPRAAAAPAAAPGGGTGERRCSHCGAQKTPQWRAGPEGAKTLCNACGVRFKSGRLLPEYRPACSPTFLSHAHSNSHRKVLEMRRKKAELGLLLLPPSPSPSPQPVPTC